MTAQRKAPRDERGASPRTWPTKRANIYIWSGLAILCVVASVVMAVAREPRWWMPLACYVAGAIVASLSHWLHDSLD